MKFPRLTPVVFFIFLSVLPDSSFAQTVRLHLQIAGNARQGFYVTIYEGNRLRITRTEEFSIKLFDLSMTVLLWLIIMVGRSGEFRSADG